jgi:hypothetical protein
MATFHGACEKRNNSKKFAGLPGIGEKPGITLIAGTGSRHLVPSRTVAGIRLPDGPSDAGPLGSASVIPGVT